MGIAAALLLCGLLAGCQTARNLTLYFPASLSGLDTVSADVQVEHGSSPQQRSQVQHLRDDAHTRLAAAVGTVQAHPIHVFCFTDGCYQRFGGGTPRAKSFGDHYTLIGPAGLTTGYVAHEWWHAELYRRLSWRQLRGVPTWFDEGVAVWVSDDPRYGEEMFQRILAQGITPPTLDELATRNGFIAAVGRHGDHLWAGKPADAITVVYPTAAREARRWMKIAGIGGLRELLARLERGEPFAGAYAELEQRGAAR